MNLQLASSGGSVGLRQTPTTVTMEAMRMYHTGANGPHCLEHAFQVYSAWLLDQTEEGDVDEAKRHLAHVSAVCAFDPKARFYFT